MSISAQYLANISLACAIALSAKLLLADLPHSSRQHVQQRKKMTNMVAEEGDDEENQELSKSWEGEYLVVSDSVSTQGRQVPLSTLSQLFLFFSSLVKQTCLSCTLNKIFNCFR